VRVDVAAADRFVGNRRGVESSRAGHSGDEAGVTEAPRDSRIVEKKLVLGVVAVLLGCGERLFDGVEEN